MRTLVTGTTGYIGSNLFEAIKGWKVPFFRKDNLLDFESFAPEVIYHCAAEIYKEEEMFDSNIVLTHNLLQFAERVDAKAFIYVGSSSEYGRKAHPISEQDRLEPITIYEATKGCGSLLALSSKVPVIVARPFSVFGKNEPLRRFIPLIYRAYKEKKILRVGPGVHDFIYIDDFVRGLTICADALLSGKTQKDIVNFGTGIQYSNIQVVRTFEEVVGERLNVEIVFDKRSYDSDCWVCNPCHAREQYGFRTTTDLRKGLELYIKYREEASSTNS